MWFVARLGIRTAHMPPYLEGRQEQGYRTEPPQLPLIGREHRKIPDSPAARVDQRRRRSTVSRRDSSKESREDPGGYGSGAVRRVVRHVAEGTARRFNYTQMCGVRHQDCDNWRQRIDARNGVLSRQVPQREAARLRDTLA